ncbi:MAG TPA: S8 family serine peptidase [Candidatus Polarisedimenticolia bacterium]|nr:S8 family serine peptidase [Candidatus Polarisedimenticolia bacterium]
MSQSRPVRPLRPERVLIPIALLLVLSASGPSPSRAAGGIVPTGWERKLDPFLRRLALGTSRRQGRFTDSLPPGSSAAARALPPFVQVERGEAPTVQVKAGLREGDEASGRGWEDLESALSGIGVEVRGHVGRFATLRVPVPSLERLAEVTEIVWLKAAHGYGLLNNVSTSAAQTAADDANTAFGRGAGVIVGVVDTGIQWTDRDFRKTDGTTRLLGIWDQTLTDPAHPPPAGFSFGAYYSKSDIDAAIASGGTLLTGDGHGHGTHVAGSAAGNGLETGNGVPAGTFAGVAADADLLVVRVFDNAGIFCDACDLTSAVQFIAQTAAAAGKPWVGNMSLGSDLGSHDGTDPDELTIDAAVGPATRGAAMAIAAGNSGARDGHWNAALPAVAASTSNTFNLTYTPKTGSDNDHVWLDLWYEGPDAVTVEIVTPTPAVTVGAARGVDSGVVCTSHGAVQVDASNAPDPVNADNEVFVQIWDSSLCAPVVPPDNGIWTIRVTTNTRLSSAPSFDLWNEADAGNTSLVHLATFTTAKSAGVPGTARHDITAGSYADKDRWINVQGTQTIAGLSTAGGVGSLSGFSGLGPTRDGRIKPDIAAPGEFVGSSLAGNIQATRGTLFTERDGQHGDISGTSMASPHVAGTAAVLLGINPSLSGPEIKAAILLSARADAFTNAPGPLPNNAYGYGKLRTLEAGYQAASIVTDLGATTSTTFGGTDSPFVDTYNVYRGSIPGLSATSYGSCFLQGRPSPAFGDTANPPGGQAFFYLVTGVHAGVEGTLGVDGAGRIRPNNTPCP